MGGEKRGGEKGGGEGRRRRREGEGGRGGGEKSGGGDGDNVGCYMARDLKNTLRSMNNLEPCGGWGNCY